MLGRSLVVLLVGLGGCAKPAPAPTEPAPDQAARQDEAPAEREGEAPFDQAAIDEEVRARVVDLRACYDSRAERAPDLQGIIVAQFVIDDEGHARDIVFESETLDDDELESCLAGVLGSIEFPRAPESESIAVTYPFDFRPQ